MHRVLLDLGPIKIYSYGAMQVVALIVGILWGKWIAKRENVDPEKIVDLGIWLIIGGIIGARLWYIVEFWEQFSDNLWEVFAVWRGGLVLYGGLIGGTIAGVIFAKRSKVPLKKLMDICAPPLALGIGIGRIGCFLNGCCYGKLSPHGLCFPKGSPVYYQQLADHLIGRSDPVSLPVIPTQLISSLDCAIIALVLFVVWRRFRIYEGFVFYVFMVLYAIHRFLIEFLRYHPESSMVGPLSIAQVMSIFLFVGALGFILVGILKRREQ